MRFVMTYTMIKPQFWIGKTGRELRRRGTDAVALALYLASSPSANMAGLYYLSLDQLASHTAIPRDRVRKVLRRVEETGYALYDDESESVFVVELACYQVGDRLSAGDTRRKAILRAVDPYKNSPLFAKFMARYGQPFGLVDSIYAPSYGGCDDAPSHGGCDDAPSHGGCDDAPSHGAPNTVTVTATATVTDIDTVHSGSDARARIESNARREPKPVDPDEPLTRELRAYAESVGVTGVDAVWSKFKNKFGEWGKVTADVASSWRQFCTTELPIQRRDRERARAEAARSDAPTEPDWAAMKAADEAAAAQWTPEALAERDRQLAELTERMLASSTLPNMYVQADEDVYRAMIRVNAKGVRAQQSAQDARRATNGARVAPEVVRATSGVPGANGGRQ